MLMSALLPFWAMSAGNYAALSAVLEALSDARRLELLADLRRPSILRDIRVRAPEGERDRDIARQAVKRHLEKLVEAGVVHAHPTKHEFGETLEYVVNHQRLFAVSEELRELAKLRPVDELDAPTSQDARAIEAGAVYPRFVVVRGLEEGRTFALQPLPGSPRAQWIIGRKRTADVAFDYDPYVSAENTLVSCAAGEYVVETLPTSRNGTILNFSLLAQGERAALEHGDVLGVGHTLIVFQTHARARR